MNMIPAVKHLRVTCLLVLSFGLSTSGLLRAGAVEEFSGQAEEIPWKPMAPWAHAIGNSWHLKPGANGTAELHSSAKTTDSLNRSGYVYLDVQSLSYAPRRVFIDLYFAGVGEPLPPALPVLIMGFSRKAEIGRAPESALTLVLTPARIGPGQFDAGASKGRLSGKRHEGDDKEVSIELLDTIDATAPLRIEFEISEDRSQGRVRIGSGDWSDWVELATSWADARHLRFYQSDLGVVLKRIELAD